MYVPLPPKPAREQEPVAWGVVASNTGQICRVELDFDEVHDHDQRYIVPLYAAPQPAIPEGFVLVPVEPTQEMLDVILNTHDVYGFAADLYKALLDAAQQGGT
jgi:hypothetical protein